jgi:hypothetical protein
MAPRSHRCAWSVKSGVQRSKTSWAKGTQSLDSNERRRGVFCWNSQLRLTGRSIQKYCVAIDVTIAALKTRGLVTFRTHSTGMTRESTNIGRGNASNHHYQRSGGGKNRQSAGYSPLIDVHLRSAEKGSQDAQATRQAASLQQRLFIWSDEEHRSRHMVFSSGMQMFSRSSAQVETAEKICISQSTARGEGTRSLANAIQTLGHVHVFAPCNE